MALDALLHIVGLVLVPIRYFFYYYTIVHAGLIVIFSIFGMASSQAAFVARSLTAYALLVCSALYGVVTSILLTIIGQQQIAQWVTGRSFWQTMRLFMGVEFVIEDPNDILNTTRPAVFIGNHQTELDVLMLGTLFPKYCSVTAKSSLKRMPFLGWFMALSGTIFIDRKNSKDAREAMKGAAQEIQSKRQSVFMFPEGTRSYATEPTMLPFKKGAFHLAVQAGVPIVPMVSANYSHVLNVKGRVFRRGKVPVKIMDPIPTKGLTPGDVDELTRTTRDKMLEELVKLTARAQGHPVPVPASTAQTSAVDTSSL